MEDNTEIIDNLDNPIPSDSDYDATSDFDEGYAQPRITFKSLFAFVLSVLNFERGILFTIKELFIRPRIVIEEYLKKDRKKLINPIRFLVFSTAVSTFLTFSFINQSTAGGESFQQAFTAGFSIGLNDGSEKDSIAELAVLNDTTALADTAKIANRKQKKKAANAAMAELGQIMSNSNDKFTFALTFFFALSCLWFFRKSGYNYTENLVVNCYMISMLNVIGIIAVLPAIFTGSTWIVVIGGFFSIVYTLYFWMMVYNRKSIAGFFRCILNYLVGYSIFSLVLLIFVIAFLFIKAGL